MNPTRNGGGGTKENWPATDWGTANQTGAQESRPRKLGGEDKIEQELRQSMGETNAWARKPNLGTKNLRRASLVGRKRKSNHKSRNQKPKFEVRPAADTKSRMGHGSVSGKENQRNDPAQDERDQTTEK
jgi:hypothetical protein